MSKLFLSVKFDQVGYALARKIQNEMSNYGVECILVGDITKFAPPEVVRSNILASDALLAIIRGEDNEWIHNEVGMAYAAEKPVYSLVEEGAEVGGILPLITTYKKFSRKKPKAEGKQQPLQTCKNSCKIGR